MTAAIYARKSTDQSAVADEAKSVRRQVEHARAYAVRRGWTVDERFVFVDDGISGAEFSKRPGFVRLMNVLRPRPPFDVLIMSEESRLGREAIETAYALKQLITAGVRLFFYLEDRERTLESPTDKVMMSITAYVDELAREQARLRTYDALIRKAKAGHVTGGRVFGYDNVEILGAAGERSHTERRVNDAEASVVRRIFEHAAAGVGQARIARLLNAVGAPTPRAQRERPSGWATSSVHAVLWRELYRGVVVWNQTRKRNRWGEKRSSDRPAAEWVRRPAPELRIVDDGLWQAAHARITEARALYRDATKGLRGGRPRIESKYLLTGLARCTCCNSGFQVRSGNHGSGVDRWRVFKYACGGNQNRGPDVCANALQMPMEQADRAVLASIGELLTPDLVDDVIARVRELLEVPRGGDAGLRDRIAEELDAAARQVARLTEAIALGAGDVAPIVARLQETDRRRQELATRAKQLGDGPLVPRIDWRATERLARQRLQDWRGLLLRQTEHARPMLKQLLEGRAIRFTPMVEGARRWYQFAGEASIAGWLLEGVVSVPDNPRGKWRPHRELSTATVGAATVFRGVVELRRAA